MNGAVLLTDWLADLRDARARTKLEIRFRRVSLGVFDDIKPVGEGVLELPEDIGLGYHAPSVDTARPWSSCCVAATSARRMRTSNEPKNTARTGNGETHEQSQTCRLDLKINRLNYPVPTGNRSDQLGIVFER